MVLIGCGAMVMDVRTGGAIGHGGIAAAFGLIVMAVIYALGHVSGAHINPAVTIAFATIGRFPWREVPAYVVAQVLGALAAAWLLSGIPEGAHTLGATQVAPDLGAMGGLAVELVLTFMLMLIIVGVATDARAVGNLAGLAIGATVALAALVGGPLTNASMNPARTLGPNLMAGVDAHLWIYMVGPVLGAVLGAWTYQFIRCDAAPPGDASGCC